MGSLSVSTHRGLVHLQGVLLVVPLLTFWSPPTIAKISIVSTSVPEGEEVVLHIHNKPPEANAFIWYKGKGMNQTNILAVLVKKPSFYTSHPERSGEYMITNDGFLLFKKVTMKDAGMYTVLVHLPNSKTEAAFGQRDVYDREDWLEAARILQQIKECKKRRQTDGIW